MVNYRRPPAPDEVPGAGPMASDGQDMHARAGMRQTTPPIVHMEGPAAVRDIIRSEFSNTFNSRIFFCVLGIALGLGLGWWMHGKART
jgi:hypothetical protein